MKFSRVVFFIALGLVLGGSVWGQRAAPRPTTPTRPAPTVTQPAPVAPNPVAPAPAPTPTSGTITAQQLRAAQLRTPAKVTAGEATNALVTTPVGQPTVLPDEISVQDGVPVKYRVTTQRVTASASYGQTNLLAPDTDVIYPGAILRGDSIDTGSYQEITSATKNPVTISYSLTGIRNGVVSGTVVPTNSSTSELRNRIMSQDIPGQASLRFQFESFEVATAESLDLMINAGGSYTGAIKAQVRSGFSYGTEKKVNRYLIKFSQTFYTADVDQGGNSFLLQNVDMSAFNGYRPVYVSSVAYGRVGFLSVETTMSMQEFKTSLETTVEFARSGGDLSTSLAKKKLSESSSISINLIGGSSTPTTLDGFLEEVRNGGFSVNNRGVRIAYKLRFLDDNTIANTLFTGEYISRQVTAYKGIYTVNLRVTGFRSNHDDAGGELELFGDVFFKRDANSTASKVLWRRSSSGTMDITENSKVGFNGQNETFDGYLSPFDQVVILLRDMGEEDPGSDDRINNKDLAMSIKDLEGGAEFVVRTDFSSSSKGWLEVYITPTVTFAFNTRPE